MPAFFFCSVSLLTSAVLLACSTPADRGTPGAVAELRGTARDQRRFEAVGPPPPGPPADRYTLSFSDYDTSTHTLSAHMTRWRGLVRDVVGRGRPTSQRDYALMMAFVYVESGGRRFAVSRSGCLGLTQFCDRTAVRWPFGGIFGAAALRDCDCWDRRCRIHPQTRRFLETTPAALHPIVAHELPCDLSDPRFVPERAIQAGWRYVHCLGDLYEYNPYLVYLGYNSGPQVARRVWAALGPRRARQLKAIGRVLRRALRPNFGRAWARRRARSLMRKYLQKVERAYQAYLLDVEETSSGAGVTPLPGAGSSLLRGLRPAPPDLRPRPRPRAPD